MATSDSHPGTFLQAIYCRISSICYLLFPSRRETVLGFHFLNFGFGVRGLGFRLRGLGVKIQGLRKGFEVRGSGGGFYDLGFSF
jgi:hypothetical protein